MSRDALAQQGSNTARLRVHPDARRLLPCLLRNRAEAQFTNAATQQEAERAERAIKAAAAALKASGTAGSSAGCKQCASRKMCFVKRVTCSPRRSAVLTTQGRTNSQGQPSTNLEVE